MSLQTVQSEPTAKFAKTLDRLIQMSKADTCDDAQGNPERQVAFEKVHDGYATSGRRVVAPSPRPMSRSRVPSDSRSMLSSGRLVKAAIRFLR